MSSSLTVIESASLYYSNRYLLLYLSYYFKHRAAVAVYLALLFARILAVFYLLYTFIFFYFEFISQSNN